MLNRRNFIKTTVAGAVLTTGGTLLSSCQAQANEPKKNDSIPYKPEAELKLSLQDWNIPGENLQQKMDFLEKYNIVGVVFGGSGLAKRVKEKFSLPFAAVYGQELYEEKPAERIAVCPGAGGSEISQAVKKGAQVLITGDIGHHTGIDAAAQGLMVIDAGHYGLEYVFMDFMEQYLKERLSGNVQIEKMPVEFPAALV